MKAAALKQYLRRAGATLVGVGDVSRALSPEIHHLNRGIAIAVRRGLSLEAVSLLSRLQGLTEEWLRKRGHRALCIPADSDRKKDKCITRLYRLFSHKTAATCSGLGWVGKNGLVINPRYGSRLSWASVLTDAPLEPDPPATESECGDCDLCVRHCPSGALKGDTWTLDDPLKELVAYDLCRSLKKDRQSFVEKPNCGFCVTVCPYSRQK